MLLMIGLIFVGLVAAVLAWLFWGQRPPEDDDFPPAGKVLALLALFAFALAGCGNAITVGRKVATSVGAAEIAAAKEWTVANRAKERAIIEAAAARNASKEEVKAELAAWRAKADRVDAALDALGDTVIAAIRGLDAYESARGKFDLARWVGPLYHAGLAVVSALQAAGVDHLPSLLELMGIVRQYFSPAPSTSLAPLRLALARQIGG